MEGWSGSPSHLRKNGRNGDNGHIRHKSEIDGRTTTDTSESKFETCGGMTTDTLNRRFETCGRTTTDTSYVNPEFVVGLRPWRDRDVDPS